MNSKLYIIPFLACFAFIGINASADNSVDPAKDTNTQVLNLGDGAADAWYYGYDYCSFYPWLCDGYYGYDGYGYDGGWGYGGWGGWGGWGRGGWGRWGRGWGHGGHRGGFGHHGGHHGGHRGGRR